MAQYDYRNEDGEVISIHQSIHDEPIVTIERENKVYHRVFHPLGFVFNTNGFYRTDNADSIEKWRRENMKGL